MLLLSGRCNTGGFINLLFISLEAICCSSPYMNCLPFLVRSYIGFNNFCNSRQNKKNLPFPQNIYKL